jgi:hypothetical protein
MNTESLPYPELARELLRCREMICVSMGIDKIPDTQTVPVRPVRCIGRSARALDRLMPRRKLPRSR